MKKHPDMDKRPPAARSGGFSLIELLVAVAVIAALALLSIQATQRIMVQSRKIGCVRNLQQIGVALLAYAADHQRMFPFQANAEPHYTPMILATALVGNMGSQGYLPWNGRMDTRFWTDAMLCPGDPNRAIYEARTADVVPNSYMYRQNAQAGRGTLEKPSIRLSLLSRPANQEGYKRWILMDRYVLGPAGIVKPYVGQGKQIRSTRPQYAAWSDRDTFSYSSYWHPQGTTVLYEDGSVSFRLFDSEPVGR